MAVRKMGASWWVDFVFAHVRYRKRSPDNSRAGAAAYEQTLRRRLGEGKPIDGRSAEPPKRMPTFAEFAREWLSIYVDTNNSASVRLAKRSMLRAHLIPFFGDARLDEITASSLERYKACKSKQRCKARDNLLAPATINQHLLVVTRCLRSAEEWGVIARVPRIAKLRVPVRRVDFLTVEEKARLLADVAEPRWNLMAEVALRTGMRLGELLGLDWSNVSFEHRVVTVAQGYAGGVLGPPKNNRVRHLPLSPELASALQPARRRSGLVFAQGASRPPTLRSAADALERICRRTGVRRIGWHMLRHTFATHAVAAGVPLRVVQEMLGHATVEMTARYAHVAPWMMHDAMDRMREFDRGALSIHGNGQSNALHEADGSSAAPGAASALPARN